MIQVCVALTVIGLKMAGVVDWGWGPIFGWYLVSAVAGEVIARLAVVLTGGNR